MAFDPSLLSRFLPELLLLFAALLVFLNERLGADRRELFGGIAVAGILGSLGLVAADAGFAPLAILRGIPASAIDAPLAPGTLFGFSSLGLLFQGFFLVAALLVTLGSLSGGSRDKGSPIFYGLLLLATLGMLLVAVAADLIFLLLALELTAISSYLLVGYTRKDARGLEAAMKFYILGALSAALSFFGASLLYGAYGTTSLLVIGHTWPGGEGSLATAGYAFLLGGLGFEVTAVPFHLWAVDVYDGAPTEVSAFLAGGTKKVGLFAFFLVFLAPLLLIGPPATTNGAARASIQLALALLAVATMTVGNLLALLQKEMKRLLAYSSISQAGYMLLGLAVGTAPALAGSAFQIFAHVFLKTGAFLVVAAAASIGVGPLVEDWRGLGLRRPWLSVAFALFLLGLAGIPLTVGFVSKFVLFSAAIRAEGWFLGLAIAGLLNSALSVFYYARVLRVMYIDHPAGSASPGAPPTDSPPPPAASIGLGRAVAIGVAAAAVVAFGVYPQPILAALQSGATQFFGLGI